MVLYIAPDCTRCKIVKAFLAERGIEFAVVDFKANARDFSAFYRARRKDIRRNSEGVEFPLLEDGSVAKQGAGEIIAYLLSGHGLEPCVARSDMLDGKISGISPSRCPDGQEENLHALVERLSAGGLQVWLQTDGRKPDLLRRLLGIRQVHAVCNVVGSAENAERVFGGAPDKEELAATIGLVRNSADGAIRFLAVPLQGENGWAWPGRGAALAAARMVAESCGDAMLPYVICALAPDEAWNMYGLAPVTDWDLLTYRSVSRQFLCKAEIAGKGERYVVI